MRAIAPRNTLILPIFAATLLPSCRMGQWVNYANAYGSDYISFSTDLKFRSFEDDFFRTLESVETLSAFQADRYISGICGHTGKHDAGNCPDIVGFSHHAFYFDPEFEFYLRLSTPSSSKPCKSIRFDASPEVWENIDMDGNQYDCIKFASGYGEWEFMTRWGSCLTPIARERLPFFSYFAKDPSLSSDEELPQVFLERAFMIFPDTSGKEKAVGSLLFSKRTPRTVAESIVNSLALTFQGVE